MSRAEVAEQLRVEVETVPTHRDRGLRKLRSRAEQVGFAALALYALAVFCFGSGLALALSGMFSGPPPTVAGGVVLVSGGYGHVVLRWVWQRIKRIPARTIRVGIMAFLACGMLTGTWCIWRFGLAAEGLSITEALRTAAIAIAFGVLLMLSVRWFGPVSANDHQRADPTGKDHGAPHAS